MLLHSCVSCCVQCLLRCARNCKTHTRTDHRPALDQGRCHPWILHALHLVDGHDRLWRRRQRLLPPCHPRWLIGHSPGQAAVQLNILQGFPQYVVCLLFLIDWSSINKIRNYIIGTIPQDLTIVWNAKHSSRARPSNKSHLSLKRWYCALDIHGEGHGQSLNYVGTCGMHLRMPTPFWFLNDTPFWFLNGTPLSCLNDTPFWLLNDTNVGVERYSWTVYIYVYIYIYTHWKTGEQIHSVSFLFCLSLLIYIYIYIRTHTHTYIYIYI